MHGAARCLSRTTRGCDCGCGWLGRDAPFFFCFRFVFVRFCACACACVRVVLSAANQLLIIRSWIDRVQLLCADGDVFLREAAATVKAYARCEKTQAGYCRAAVVPVRAQQGGAGDASPR